MDSNTDKPVKPWDLFNSNQPKVDNLIAQERLNICLNCEFLFKLAVVCKKCGCLMHGKVKLSNAFCPIGKWDKKQ